MEVCGKSGLKRRPLTPLRIIRGLLCLVVFLSTAFTFLVYLGPIYCVLFRLFSLHYSRRATSFFFGIWLALWPFLFEKINGTKVVFSGDKVPPKERVLIIANHRTEVDWMYLWDLAIRKGSLGCIKYVLKSSLMKLPVFGWGFHILEFIPVERKWEVDEPIMHQMLSTFANPEDPLWLVVFPEGTDFTGFNTCTEALRGSLDAVYDVTIGYRHQCPSFMDNVFGVDPSEVHIHVRRIPLEEIPSSETDVTGWLMSTFNLKDQLLSDFTAQGHFPHQGIEGELSTFKCWVNFAVVIASTCLFTYLTIFSSIWFRLYVGLSCAYLAFATCTNFRPPPILSSEKATLYSHKIN
ncbi:Acyltransferase, C-terminal domain [Dillenia turbinata]|uniref:1-acylglycerol-3-phosphate O-acyltransferase n=1 Tax=Dillenia turbinata TaxID=194707 RepID=A0AAN8ZLV2_9MAGN